MKKLCNLIFIFPIFALLFFVSPSFSFASTTNGTIDSSNKYAWSENAGWINFGTTQGNVIVTASELTGYAWSENLGWISLNCSNDNSCATSNYKVANDGKGVLSGYAYGENVGWINFGPTGGGVSISTSTGEFSGYAWAENTGWIVFDCATSACVKTDWRPLSGGGGLPAGAYNLPTIPVGGFKILINQGASATSNRIVNLTFNAGSDVKKMAISNSAGFEDAGQENYATTKTWTLLPNDGVKTVYVKFYTSYGQPSQTVSGSIILKGSIVSSTSTGCMSYSNVSDQITCLTSLIAQLTQQIAQLTNAFTQSLQYGSNGSQVVLLQDVLKKLGFFPQSIQSNGNFGSATLKAVEDFQIHYNIAQPGVAGYGRVGPKTRQMLNQLD